MSELEQLKAEVTRLTAERDRYRTACIEQSRDIEQVLGRALGYPENQTLPEIGGVPGDTHIQVFDHTAESLADEAAEKITKLTAERDALREALEAWWGHHFFEWVTDEPGWYGRLQAKNKQQVRAIALTKPLLAPAETKG